MSVPLITVTGFQCLYPLSPLITITGFQCLYPLSPSPGFNVCTPYHRHRVSMSVPLITFTGLKMNTDLPPPPPPPVFTGKGKVVGGRPGDEGGAAGDTVTRKPSESGTWPRWLDTQPQKKAPSPSTSSAAVTRLGRCTALNGEGFTRTYRTKH